MVLIRHNSNLILPATNPPITDCNLEVNEDAYLCHMHLFSEKLQLPRIAAHPDELTK